MSRPAATVVDLRQGDCRKVLADLEPESVHAVITDPPYELGFMDRGWDSTGVAYDPATWAACLRVLKPGGHLAAFGASRTFHRLAVAIEDAGFELRDTLCWLYGSGFPKSLDVSKAIDKRRYERGEVLEVTAWVRAARDAAGLTNAHIDAAFGFTGMAGHWTTDKSQPAVPTIEQVPTLLEVLGVGEDDVPERVRALLLELNGRKGTPGRGWLAREVTGVHDGPNALQEWKARIDGNGNPVVRERRDVPHLPEAEAWQGWGTALKPAWEPIVLARKPLGLSVATVAATVLEHGTGAIHVDACRLEAAGDDERDRWPPNVVADELAAAVIDAEAGEPVARFFYCPKASTAERNAGLDGWAPVVQGVWGGEDDDLSDGKRRTNPTRNLHPTVKPVALMRWLVRLLCPPGGTVLDPFLGSGTTGMAVVLEDVADRFVGVELDDAGWYLELARSRIAWTVAGGRPEYLTAPVVESEAQPSLFDG